MSSDDKSLPRKLSETIANPNATLFVNLKEQVGRKYIRNDCAVRAQSLSWSWLFKATRNLLIEVCSKIKAFSFISPIDVTIYTQYCIMIS